MGTHRIPRIAVLTACILSPTAQAWKPDLTLYDQNGNMARGTLAVDAGYFAQDDSWYGKSRENLGKDSSDWGEAAVTPGLEGELDLKRLGGLYGRVSAAGGYTWSIDGAGSNVDQGSTHDWALEDAYLGWRSGKLPGSLGDDALDLSVGRRNYQAGTGFLFWSSAGNSGKRGAFWISPRKAADMAAIARLRSGNLSLDGVYLNPNDYPDSDTKIGGLTVDYALGAFGSVGGGYYHVLDSEIDSRDGMDVYDLRVDLTPLSALPRFGLQGEYVYEKNGSTQAASAGYAKALYRFEALPWSPTLSYRYAWFEGDNPNSSKDENFDPLYYGFSDWGTWYIGEILGEYVLGNQNMQVHTVQLQTTPAEDWSVGLFYYQFRLDNAEGFDASVSDKDFAKEIDLTVDWSATETLTISAVGAVTMPDDGAKQFTGGNDNWWYLMLLGSLRF